MSLRIIGGEFGGRILKTVRGQGTRPLLGQVREALFNILGDQIEGAFVWDLFAGTGSSGMESLSRGAARVLFVEKNGKAIDILRNNLQSLGDDAFDRGVVVRADAWDPPIINRPLLGGSRGEEGVDESTVEHAPENGVPEDEVPEIEDPNTDATEDGSAEVEVPPDIIFLDPPYSMVAEDPVKSMARARRLLDRTAPNGCVLFHFESGVLDEDDFDTDLDVDLREWGTSVIAMLWRKGEAPESVYKRHAKERARGGE